VALHNFLKLIQKDARIYLWGHSLGTGYMTWTHWSQK
jgi:hypothetical protein